MSIYTPAQEAIYTSSLASILSLSSSTWEIIPTNLPPLCNSSKLSIALSKDCGSSVPKPSSTNIVSSDTPPAFDCTISERPKANDSDALKLSPPDNELTSLELSV